MRKLEVGEYVTVKEGLGLHDETHIDYDGYYLTREMGAFRGKTLKVTQVSKNPNMIERGYRYRLEGVGGGVWFSEPMLEIKRGNYDDFIRMIDEGSEHSGK